MKIGIVLHPFGESQPAGLARTIFEFTKGMLEVDDHNEYVIFLKKQPATMPELPGKRWRVEVLGGGVFWLERLRQKTPVDVCIFNTPVMPLFFRPKRSIVIALDFWYIMHPAQSIRTWLLSRLTFLYHWISLCRADLVVAISQATKTDTMRLFGIPDKKISVVLCGYKKICAVPQAPPSVPLPRQYFLFVGVVKERKNVLRMVEAFARIAEEFPDQCFVIGGNAKGAYADKIRSYIQEQRLGQRVIWLGHLDDGQMSFVYQHATAVVFPTLLEGFGFPILEAMDCGIPVITSNQSSLVEVAGNAALLVDPYDSDAIAEAMRCIIRYPERTQQLIADGRARAGQFSWQKAGRMMLDIVHSS